jgi:aminomethyltransferase
MIMELKKTHLYEYHKSHGKLTPFADFEMPIWYKGIIPEHLAVRKGVGIFDVTHMGRVIITGVDSEAFLNYVTTNNVSDLTPLDAHYSVMCNKEGGIKDDFVVSRLGTDQFFMVYNASNRGKNFAWLTKQKSRFDVEIQDKSDIIAMFAVQGPKAEETLQKIATTNLGDVKRFKCAWTELADYKTFLSRTGYTGEDGFEVFIWDSPTSEPKKAVEVWNAILEAGKDFGIESCGLGARDSLRLEAGLCLYGNDLNEETTPLEARVSFVVKLQKENFIGKEMLIKQKDEGVKKKRVGLRMAEQGIPRRNHKVFKETKEIGVITSGTFSPLLRQGIAMAYIQSEHAKRDEIVTVKIRDRMAKAKIVKTPFYNPNLYGYSRKT